MGTERGGPAYVLLGTCGNIVGYGNKWTRAEASHFAGEYDKREPENAPHVVCVLSPEYDAPSVMDRFSQGVPNVDSFD